MASTARLDELKKKFDENPRRYFAPLANEHRKSGDLDQAIALCRTHLPQQPAHISGHIVLAQALFEAGSLDEARDIFHSALGLDPENLIALRYLGDIARDANDVETARSWYQRVLEVDPRNDEIVQIVRDLDEPSATAEEVSVAAPAEPRPVASEGPSESHKPPVDNARFELLSMDSLELDASLGSPADAPPSNAGAATDSSGSDETLDVHAEWSADQPTVELPTIDAPEIDPFDLIPGAGAESLFDAGSTPADDVFLTELAQDETSDHAAFEGAEPAAEAWSSAAPADESAPEPRAAAEASAFEEGSFYPEVAPADAPAAEMANGSPAMDAAAFDLPEAPPPAEPIASESVAANVAAESIDDATASVDDHLAGTGAGPAELDVAESPTSEWQTPERHVSEAPMAGGHDELGLEVMEFVPPSSAPSTPVTGLTSDADPLIGRMPELGPPPHGATPPAFVTETMAELYLQQGFRNEALAVYRELLSRNPSDASLRERVEQIESGFMSSLGMATLSDTVVESALKRQSAKPAKSVRSFFASLAGRRAPMPPAPVADVDAPAVSEDTPEYADFEAVVDSEAVADSERTAPSEAFVAESNGPSAAAPATEPVAPMMSAAETLASFDPFADAGDLPSADAVAESLTAEPLDANDWALMPNVDVATRSPESNTSAEPPAGHSLEALFPDTPVTPHTEAAAQTLATAFGRTEPQGRPTRAANSELSLDTVFRGSSEGTPPVDGGFSFDQFFSDARPSEGGDVVAPAMSPPETGRSGGGAGDVHDIEQFTAWLEGLKKK